MIYDSDFIDIGAFHDGLVAQAQRVLDKTLQQMAQSDVAGETKIVDSAGVGGSATQDILDAAADFHSDIVVMGSHGRRGFQRFVLGSVA
ncbi:Universal stress protein family [Bordetella ansorpii]|uniref:Universal stress protein family n=1 Tax=Bordetella ansorpii TaxID=288768 RepID=A0A157SJ68_9BORD|nr:Universal stress protein family [Bordetella ansorpii]